MQKYNAFIIWCLFLILMTCGILPNGKASEQKQFRAVLTRGDHKIDEPRSDYGEVYFEVRDNGESMHYILRVKDITDITMVHLHLGTIGKIGTPVVWLYPEAPPPKQIDGSFTGVLAEGTITSDDLIGPLRGKPLKVLFRELRAGKAYVNIHTVSHPESEVYGRIQ